jgi:hypothetical protein
MLSQCSSLISAAATVFLKLKLYGAVDEDYDVICDYTCVIFQNEDDLLNTVTVN